MSGINYDKLRRALQRLKEQHENFLKLNDQGAVSEINKEAVKESVIKRFEICIDTLWKHLKKHLRFNKGLADLPNSPNGVFRCAWQAKIIDRATLKSFMDYNALRASAAHEDNKEKADEALEAVSGFIQEAENLYQAMIGSDND